MTPPGYGSAVELAERRRRELDEARERDAEQGATQAQEDETRRARLRALQAEVERLDAEHRMAVLARGEGFLAAHRTGWSMRRIAREVGLSLGPVQKAMQTVREQHEDERDAPVQDDSGKE